MKTIYISVGRGCPFKCSYCYHRASEIGISVELANKIFCSLGSQFKYRIAIGGNEPLAYWPTVKEIFDSADKTSKFCEKLILTNGILLTHEIIYYLSNHNIKVGLSLNHLLSSNEIKEKISLLNSFKVQFYLNLLLTRRNIKKITNKFDSLCNDLTKERIEFFSLSVDFTSKERFRTGDLNTLIKIIKLFMLIAHRYNLFIKGDWDRLLSNVDKKHPSKFCHALPDSVFITKNYISPCALLSERASVSDINPNSFQRLNNKISELSLKREIWCKKQKCKIYLFCRGGCLAIQHPEVWCKFMNKIIKLILEDKEIIKIYFE